MKKIYLIFILLLLVLTGCKGKNSGEQGNNNPPDTPKHVCTSFHKEYDKDAACGTLCDCAYICDECGEIDHYEFEKKPHDLYEKVIEPKCEEAGKRIIKCHNCDYLDETSIQATGHQHIEYVVDREPNEYQCGRRHKECLDCGEIWRNVDFAANGFSYHGKLSVKGADLVDEHGEKFQLIGLSTHGIQWAYQYINYETLEAVRNEFGINVIRLSLYPEEGGYSDCNETQKKFLYNKVVEGIEAATALDMYVIVDWHMLGTGPKGSENPNFRKEDAAEFFSQICEQFKDSKNLLFEIMNEPSGDTNWTQCKAYANYIIPKIRKWNDGVILVGNPHWTADLYDPLGSPLDFENLMYAFHFYAAGEFNTEQVIYAYKNGLPIFVTEHGGMGSDGDGAINYDNIKKWYKVLDERNISYVAWNLSNTKCSASIIKYMSSFKTDFSDDNLKEWGQYYKKVVRTRFGLPVEEK